MMTKSGLQNMKHGLVIEDLPETRAWLVAVLECAFSEIRVCTGATVKEGMEQVEAILPDIAVIDLGLPDGTGVILIEHINRTSPDTACVVATIFDDDEHLFPALQAGATGYLLKDRPEEEIVAMLQGLIDGQPPLSPSVARRLLTHFQCRKGMSGGVNEVNLTTRETEVLQLIAKGYTANRTAELLKISPSTTAGYVKEIYRKLNVHSRAEATQEAVKRGLV